MRHAGAPQGFVIAGGDRHFHPAELENVDGGKFAVTSPFVADPVAVRYAWGVHPMANFGNRAGPAAPFRTDERVAWIDEGNRRGDPTTDPNAAGVPTSNQAREQTWERKEAQARKVLEEYETWKAARKPKVN